MNTREYLAIARARWLSIALLTLLGIAVAYAWSAVQPRVYAADATGFISTGATGNLEDAALGDNYARSRATSYLDIAKSRAVADYVISELNLDVSPQSLVDRITVTSPAGSVVVMVSAEAATPQDASDLANTWLRGLVNQVIEVENAGATGDASPVSIVRLIPVDSAAIATAPVSPNVRLALAIGALLGFTAGIAFALARHTLDRRVRDIEGVEKEHATAVIGAIPVNKRLAQGNRLAATQFEALRRGGAESEAGVNEAFRQLRTNLRYMSIDNPPRIIVITSPTPGDGKSTVAANLAAAIAAGGQDVVLVDGDLRRPTVARTFDLPDGGGLTDVLVGTATAADVIHTVGADRKLHLLPAGHIPPNPSELLGSQTMHRLLGELAREAVVLIDAPPLLPVTDAAVLAANTDGAIIVAAVGRTTQEQLSKALGYLERVRSTPLGVILNRVSLRGPDRSEYYRYDYSASSVERHVERHEEQHPTLVSRS